MNRTFPDTPTPSRPDSAGLPSAQGHKPRGLPRHFYVPLVKGTQAEVVSPLMVLCCQEGDVFVSKALNHFESLGRTAKESLLNLQEILEWEYLDLSGMSSADLTDDAKEILARLSRYFAPKDRNGSCP